MLQLMVGLAELKSRETDLIDQNEDLTNRLNQLERSRLQISAKGKGRVAETDPGDSYPAFENTSGLIPGGSSSRMWDSSEELAKFLQAQFDEEDQKLATEHQRLQRRYKVFECGVCFETFVQDFVARVRGCKHSFCRDCLRQHATTTIEDRRYPIPCPACLADNSRKPMSELIFNVDWLVPNHRQISIMTFCKPWVYQIQHMRYSKSCSSQLILSACIAAGKIKTILLGDLSISSLLVAIKRCSLIKSNISPRRSLPARYEAAITYGARDVKVLYNGQDLDTLAMVPANSNTWRRPAAGAIVPVKYHFTRMSG